MTTMVKPGSSKRKLFSASKEQKENEPGVGVTKPSSNFAANEKLGKDAPVGPQGLKNLSNIGGQRKNNAGSGGCGSGGRAVGWKAEDVAVTHLTPSRPVMPMSERQQIALLMQISSPSPPDKVELSRSSSPRTPTTPSISRGVNKRNERGETPLLVAAIKGDTERISQLIAQGADVNATDYAGWSALHEACNRGFYGVSKLLIEAGADVNAKGLDNDTPLHDACINNHFKLVRLLLRCGAGVDVVNRRGKTPRDVCRSPGIITLIEAAASGNLQDLGSSSGDETPQLQEGGSCSTMSRRTPPANKSSEEKPGGGPGSPRVTLRLPNNVSRTPDKPRLQDSKNIMENSEDVYEFKCKDENRVEEEEEDKNANTARPDGAPAEEKSEKRTREPEGEEDEEARKKRRLENKEAPKGAGRGAGRPAGTVEKTVKTAGRGNNNNNSTVAKPSSSTGGSGTGVTGGGSTASGGGGVSGGGGGGGAGGGGATTGSGTGSGGVGGSTSSSSTSSGSGSAGNTGVITTTERKSPMGSAANSPKPGSTKGGDSSEDDEIKSESSTGAGPKVPPLKIVLGGGNEQEASARNGKSVANRQLPYVVNSSSGEEKEVPAEGKEAVPTVKMEDQGNSNSSSGSEKGSGTRITRSQRGGNSSSAEENTTDVDTPVTSTTIKTEIKVEEPTVSFASPDDAVHPRKRKLVNKIIKDSDAEPPMVSLVDQPISNCYETFLKIRKQIERRRENLRPVQPKPPQGFKDYLMNRCSYVLAGNATSRLSVPVISPPASLTQALKDLFNDQEKDRYRLRLQHLIEKEKLVLSVEQEILRVHGRAARALANQALPFSVCTFLKDEEVYNITAPEQEKDGNARSRYNGRLFLSWLQDVDDKWDKIKESMVLRHHNEAESLHAVQRMDWEWKLKELGECDANSRPHIDELHVPMVHVSEDFDLLPA
ncbi:ankyrin repeat domain-containing protein 11-like isoform X3 [Macrobrachium nipponense]|uniref:ankyrin repeat domain-containing protein 11-like isoform X3 n=1 Tax=Macrobrachium nipponense TaxID=159736 RepID=UPI0030C8587A